VAFERTASQSGGTTGKVAAVIAIDTIFIGVKAALNCTIVARGSCCSQQVGPPPLS
jgi:hypothetical protein